VTNDELIRALVAEMKPVRRLANVERRTWLWAAFGLFCVSLGTYVFDTRGVVRADLREPSVMLKSGLLLLVSAVTARSAFKLSVPSLGNRLLERWLPVAAMVTWFVLLAVQHAFGASCTAIEEGRSLLSFGCVGRTAVLALIPTLSILVMLRHAAPLEERWTASLGLVSSTALAVAGTEVLCSKAAWSHVVVWHAGPLCVAALAGLVLGKPLFRRYRSDRQLQPGYPV
jgi:hypothetical protein